MMDEVMQRAASTPEKLPDADASADENTLLPHWNRSYWDELLHHTQTVLYSAGDTVVRAGSSERALYVVAYGKVSMYINANKRLRLGLPRRKAHPLMTVFEAGSVINVLTFFDGKPSIATYRAATTCQLLYLNVDAFTIFSARHPELGRDVLFDLGRLLTLQTRQLSSLLFSYRGNQ